MHVSSPPVPGYGRSLLRVSRRGLGVRSSWGSWSDGCALLLGKRSRSLLASGFHAFSPRFMFFVPLGCCLARIGVRPSGSAVLTRFSSIDNLCTVAFRWWRRASRWRDRRFPLSEPRQLTRSWVWVEARSGFLGKAFPWNVAFRCTLLFPFEIPDAGCFVCAVRRSGAKRSRVGSLGNCGS